MTGLTLIQEFIQEENIGHIMYFPNRYFEMEKKILVDICTCWQLHFNRAFITALKTSDYKTTGKIWPKLSLAYSTVSGMLTSTYHLKKYKLEEMLQLWYTCMAGTKEITLIILSVLMLCLSIICLFGFNKNNGLAEHLGPQWQLGKYSFPAHTL